MQFYHERRLFPLFTRRHRLGPALRISSGPISVWDTKKGAGQVDTLGLMRDFLAERLDVARDKVVPEAKLADLGVDSLMFAEMLFEFEDRANTELDIRSADALPETVGELITLIDAHLQTGTAAAPAPVPPSTPGSNAA